MRLSVLKRNLFPALLITASVLFSGTAKAFDDIASGALVDRVGLTVQWFSSSGVGASGRLVDWHLNVNEDAATTFFTITAGKYRESFSENKLDAFGKPLGVGGRDKEGVAYGGLGYAELRKEILTAEFVNEGVENPKIEIQQYSQPQTTIYTLASSGAVRAIDGDTGKTRWSNQIGSPTLPCIGIGSNNNYVAAVNGSTVYCLESKTGKVLWSAKCRNAVGSSPGVSDEKIYVPLLNGRLEVFDIEQQGVSSSAYVEMGEGTARPVITERTVGWPNSRGNFNVAARYDSKSVSYQLRADDAIVSSPTFSNGMYYVSSLDGFVYAVNEERGTVSWQVSTGFGIAEKPIVLGNFLFVINANRELYKIDLKTGLAAQGWQKPIENVERYLGASKGNLYVLDRFNNLKVMSQDSGAVLSSVMFGDIDKVLTNDQTDRIYVATKRGVIQCVREKSQNRPYYHDGSNESMESKAAQKFNDDPATPQPGAMAEEDPFGGPASDDVNPFSDAAPAAAAEENPFGGGAKTDKSDDEDNPFK